MKKLWGILLAAALLPAAIYLSGWAGTALAAAMEKSEQGFLFEYASEGKFSENVYFSLEAQERSGILDTLLPRLDPGGLMGLCGEISRYQAELLPVFLENTAYMEYLWEKDTSLTELYRFCERMDELGENLIFACRYLLFLGWVFLLHFLVKSRPFIYLWMGVLCVFASALRISDRLFAGLFSDGEFLFHLYAKDLVPSMLEAMLTFLIFDITFAAWEKQRLARRLEPLYQDLPALLMLMDFLSRHIQSDTLYRPHLRRLLPRLLDVRPPRGARGKRLAAAVRALEGPHSNRTLYRDLADLWSLLPPRQG